MNLLNIYDRYCAAKAAKYHSKYIRTINSMEKIKPELEKDFLDALD